MAGHGEYETITFPGGVVVEMTASNALNVCYYDTVNTNLSVWKISNPMVNDVPLFAAQLSLTIFMIRLLFFIFNFFRQPRLLEALDNVAYPAMVIVFVLMTALVKPFPYWASQSSKHLKKYNQRTIETSNEDSELRIILCVHESHHLSGISTLLKFSNSTKRSPISIFALHLVELTGRSSAMLIVHDAYNCSQSKPTHL
ncbi:hypothetical protein NC652_013168 [Populus alba x Populus x berolinensis]|nr:hypothetical protein NC652_013168 [Populus alba x Populus x berolinensis]